MSDRKISEFSSIDGAGVDVDNDYIEIVDSSAAVKDRNKRITPKELIANASTITQSGTGAVSRTVQDKERAGQILAIEDYGGGYAMSAGANYSALNYILDAFGPGGGTAVYESTNLYDHSAGGAWSDKPVIIQGRGSQLQPGVGTRLRFPAGVVGLTIQNGSSGLGANSGLRDVVILGQDTGAGSNYGVKVQCSRFTAINVVVSKFGSHGYYVASGSGNSTNANDYLLLNCTTYANYGDGFHADGSNCIGTTVELSTNSNAGWGLYDDGLGVKHFGPIIENNSTGGHRIGTSGLRCRTYAAYKETDSLPGIQIDAGAGANKLDYLSLSDSITDNGTIKSEITSTAGSAVLNRRFSVGNTTANIVLSDLLALLDLGTTLEWKNAAQDTIWTMQCLADGRMSMVSAQAKALFLQNMLQANARIQEKQGAVVASANDVTLGTDGNYFPISGTTQINRIVNTDWQGGSKFTLYFQSTPTVKHNQSGSGTTRGILLNGAVDFVAAADNTLTLRYDSTLTKFIEIARKV